ncbi:hypothetical protein AB0L55_36960 [Streptomyces anthocyanicus]|uniref:hypothetical protein n=1 Tax=Streptomyces anthocyanicus TaxID=68174 RepID=UPI00342894D3
MTTTKYTLRLSVEDQRGHSWMPVQDTVTGIRAAVAWRTEAEAWCERNPLPQGYRYRVLLPRAIDHADNPPADDILKLRTEITRLREEANRQCMEADYWRESYRLAKGLSHDEIGAIIAVRDASKAHPRPCNFPHKACICDD